MNRYGLENERISGLLTEAQSRHHRARAWRHCLRINRAGARAVWAKRRAR